MVQNVERRGLLLLVTLATDLSLRTIKCCFFGVTLAVLVINILSSSPAINKLSRLLLAIKLLQLATVR